MKIDRKLGWTEYGKLKKIFSMNIPMTLKGKVYNECILPVVTYGCESTESTSYGHVKTNLRNFPERPQNKYLDKEKNQSFRPNEKNWFPKKWQ